MRNLPLSATGAVVALTLFTAAAARAPAPGVVAPGVVAHLTTPAASQEAGDAGAIRSFKIAVPPSVLTDLKERLKRARFPEEIPGMNWNDGIDLTYLKQFVPK